MQDNDEELLGLIARCAIRDQQALKLLFDRLGPYLNAVAFRIVRHDEAASEVLQEAFLQIWENAASYPPHQAKPLTWMTSIIRYRALDRLDKEKRLDKRFVVTDHHDILGALDTQNSQSGPEEEASRQQTRADIQGCLSLLNEKIRQSINLAYIHGYTREELAEKFETNVNTIKSWLRRGSERLKQCLEAKIAANR